MQEKKHIQKLADKLIRFLSQRENTSSLPDENEVWDKIEQQIKHYRFISFYLPRIFIAAASVCVLVLSGYNYIYQKGKNDDTIKNIASIIDTIPNGMNNKEVLLVMSDAEKIQVKQGDTIAYTKNGLVNINSKQIEPKANQTEKIHYNQILVPKGKHTQLVLADGSSLHINSGTRVVYPRQFSSEKREIYVEGEIYLEVKRDEKKPFIVKTKSFDVEVLGTTFNVSAYNEDEKAEVVLLNGSVIVKDEKKQSVNLKPNELVAINKGTAGSKQQVNALDYVSWTQGILVLNDDELQVVLSKLQRYYGVEIVFDASLKLLPMSGKLDMKDSLEEVLKLITATAPLNYEKREDKFYITKHDE